MIINGLSRAQFEENSRNEVVGGLVKRSALCVVEQQTHKRFNVFSNMLSHCALSCLMRVFRDFVSVRRSGKDGSGREVLPLPIFNEFSSFSSRIENLCRLQL